VPTVSIVNPSDGDSFYVDEYIEFQGKASDDLDGDLTGEHLVWTSDLISASFGTGNIVKINTLTIGEHLITLTAKNSSGIAGIDFISITVANHPPVPLITSPNSGNSFDAGEVIRFAGYATDEEDGDLTGSSLSWKSNIDGYLGSGVQFSKALSYGEHTISLTAKDSHGDVATYSISLTINPTDESLPLTLEEMDFSLPLGQIGEITVNGGHPPYRYYKEYPYIASIDIIGNTIQIVPKTMGKTTFKIVDHYNNTEILSLTVTDSLENVPLADAGDDQDVAAGTGVVLDGSSSSQGSNGIVSWSWSQEDSNKKVVLSDSSSSKITFVAPAVSEILSSDEESATSATIVFRLTVEDSAGNKSYDDVEITVSDNGIEGYPQGVTTFYTVDKLNHLGVRIVGNGDIVMINPRLPEFIQDTLNRPENMIYGLVDLNIKVEAGDTANMIIYFPQSLGEEVLAYKYSTAKGWYEYSDHITFSSDRTKAYLILTDGGTGDDDGAADGMISDPITFGTKSSSTPDTPSNDGGGGGGGCFISTIFN